MIYHQLKSLFCHVSTVQTACQCHNLKTISAVDSINIPMLNVSITIMHSLKDPLPHSLNS